MGANDGTLNYYAYDPSIVAAIIFMVLFGITTGLHVFQAARKRTFYFIAMIIGGFFEVAGYLGRALAHSNQHSMGIFILQILTLLIAPTLFAASIYMILGRLIIFTQGEAMSPIRARWLTKIFVCGDIVSFLVQALGGSMLAKESTLARGKSIILVGLFIQIIFFGFFLVCGGIFHYRIVRSPTPSSVQNNWLKYMYTLYGAGFLILIRSLFRVLEFVQGPKGTIQTHEAYLYVFDGVLMLGVMVMFNVAHPGELIGRKAVPGAYQLDGREEGSDGSAIFRK